MRKLRFQILIISMIIIAGCSGQTSLSPEDVETQVAATVMAQGTATAEAEKIINDLLTASAPSPTVTSLPVTDTPTPVPPTETPTQTPSVTPTPTKEEVVSYQTKSGDCKNETGNIEFRNNSGGVVTITLTMNKKGRTCSYFIFLAPTGGSSWFWVEPGYYTITMNACGNTVTINNTLNSGWWFRFKAC